MIIGDMEIRLRADIARLQRDMDDARRVVGNTTAAIGRAADMAKAALSGIAGAAGLAKIAQMSDEYSKLTAQLRLATDSTRAYAQAYADVKRIANSSQSDLGATGALYASLSRATKELGVSQKGVADITEAVNLAFKISGAGAQETQGALIQLSQAFASGALRGDEFNSVNEAAPRLMQAIADSIGMPVGALRDMAAQGKLTAEVVASALPKALGQLQSEAAQIQTISGAFTVLKNNVVEFTGTQAQSSGAVSALTGAITGLANNLDALAKVGIVVATVYGSRVVAGILESAKAKISDVIASQAQTRANEEAAAATLRRAQAERQTALIAQSKARETTAMVRAEVAADQQRVASAALAAEQQIVVRQGQFAATAAIVRQEIALEQVRLAAQINSIGRAQRTAELASLATQLAAIERGMAAQSSALTAQRVANEQLVANAATAGAARIATAREAEVVATGAAATATMNMRAANAALTASTAAASGASVIARGALAALGGPIGAVVTVLGLAATAWMTWGNKAKEANDKALTSMEETSPQMIERLNKEIEKLKERKALLDAKPEVKSADDKDQAGLARLQADLKAIKGYEGEYYNQSDALRDMRIRIVTRQINEAMAALNEKQALKSAIAAASDESLIGIRQRLAGVNQQYLKDLEALSTAREKGIIGEAEYKSLVSQLATETWKSSAAGKEAEKQSKATTSAVKSQAEAYSELLNKIQGKEDGQDPDFQKNVALLYKGYQSGKQSLSEYVVTMEAYIGQQKSSIQIERDAAKAKEELAKFEQGYSEGLEATSKTLGEMVAKAQAEAEQNEETARTYGLSKAQIERLTVARLEDQLAQRASLGLTQDEIETLEKVIAAKKRTAAALGSMEEVDAQKKVWESIEQTAHDTFISIFDSGKSAFDRLRDALKNGLLDLLYQMTLKQWIINIGASVSGGGAAGGAAAAAGSAASNGIGSAIGSSLGLTGAMSSFGSFAATGFMNTVAGTGLSSGLSAAGALISNGSVASGLGMGAGALGPYALAAAAIYSLAKSLDHSGTPHIGGASSVDQYGTVSTVRAESLNFEKTQVSDATNQFTAGIASSIGAILNGTATAFGKQAAYSVAAAFADDSSKDGAWGGLVISQGGQRVLNWQDDRTSRWAPREFADGEAGQKQYLAEVSKSVRAQLDAIGLPAWAGKMLDQLGNAPALEDLAKTVDTINATQKALAVMGERLVGFSALSDDAVSALMSAAGGIDALATNAGTYYDAFYSDAEKTKVLSDQVADALKKVGVVMPTTREEYRAQVEAQLALGTAGAPAAAALLGVAGAIDQLFPAAQSAVKTLQQIADERKGLMDQLDELTMPPAELLAKRRAAVDESNRALFDQVQAAQAAKDAIATQNSLLELQGQIAELTGDKAGAAAVLEKQHAAALAELDPALRGATEKLWALQEAAKATEQVKADAATLLSGVDSAFSALQQAVDREKTAVQASVDAHSAAATRLQSLSQALHGAFDGMQSPEQQLAARATGQAQIRAALAAARAGGPLPDADSLKDALAAVRQDASDQFSNRTDYLRDLYKTQNDIGALAGITDDQLSVEEKALQAAQDQLKSLDGVLARAQEQIDVLKGQSTTLLSIEQALGALSLAIKTAQANPVVASTSAITNAYQDALGRAPDATGLAFWQDKAAAGVSTPDIVDAITGSAEAKNRAAIQKLYKDLLGRQADDAGLGFFASSGASLAEIAAAIKRSDEYKAKVPGFANGGDFGGGVRMVGEVGPEIETTGASRIHSTQSLIDALRNPSDNSAVLAAAVERLTATVERQERALEQIQRNTRRQADTIDVVTEGGKAMRTKEQTT